MTPSTLRTLLVSALAIGAMATQSGASAVAASAVATTIATNAVTGTAAKVTTKAAAKGATIAVAKVDHFSPSDSAKQVRQVAARFSSPMVALGDPRLADPFIVSCTAPGKGRWADGRNWIYDFDADLPGGVRCGFMLRDGLRALNGASVTGKKSFTFDTGGPALEASFPSDGWEELDEHQVFLLRLDAAATTASIQQHAYCVVEGLSERIPVKVLAEAERAALLAQRQQFGYAYYNLLWKSGERSAARVRDHGLDNAEKRISVLQCQRTLPPATNVQLVLDAGIATTSGIATRTRQQLAFHVRPAFSARMTCTRTEPRAGCTPSQPITLVFTSPVPAAQASAVRLRIAGDDLRKPDASEAKQAKAVESISFKGPFPENVMATIEMPKQFNDDAGRALENASRFPLQVPIDEYPPLVKFAADFGIVEANEGGVLPVTLRNIDAATTGQNTAINGRMQRVAANAHDIASALVKVETANNATGKFENTTNAKGESEQQWHEHTGEVSVFRATDITTTLSIPKPLGARPSEVVGIPLIRPGLYIVELQSRRLGASLLGRDVTRYVASAALVTNLAVHLKWGRESSHVWVTRLDTGVPVSNAHVVVSNFCGGAERWHGNTDRDGIANIEQNMGNPHSGSGCNEYSPSPLIATASVGDDTSFVLSSWDKGIAPHEFGIDTGSQYDVTIAHTVFDRALFRAGETVSMKHFLRAHVRAGVAVADSYAGVHKVIISHRGSDTRYEFDVRFGADGVAEQRWNIPDAAKHGEYNVSIVTSKDDERESGGFKVEDFRLPTMTASVQGSPQPLVRPRAATFDLHVGYVSGGSAPGLPVKVRTVVEASTPLYPAYEDFQFDGEAVHEGVVTSNGDVDDLDFESDTPNKTAKAQVTPLTLDAAGAARVTIPNLPATEKPSSLIAELEYADANGELLTTSSRVRLVPAALSVGIRRESWVASSEQLRFRVVVLDLNGKPLASRAVTAALYSTNSYSYRKRLIGGFYTYESVQENIKLAPKCSGKTNTQGLLVCDVAPGVSGEVVVRAEARDDSGYVIGANASIWVAGKDDWWFGGTAGDRMDVLPEQPEYEVGQTARFQVRMPFRSATALVTVEREGVIKSFVTTLSGRAPVINVPIEAGYSPNVFVSVLAVRGRVPSKQLPKNNAAETKEITALVDLNKPTYRLGTAGIRVGWKPHRLNVRITPERTTYAVREKAKVNIEVKRADGTALPAGAEIALAVVDEALLELAPNPSLKLLDAMMGKRGLEVLTSTAQMQVIGKRHFGRKAVPHGGGGGRERARESFATLLAWQGRVVLDAQGHAQVTVPLNDSLTSFRIVAVAHAGAQLYGTGSANIATHQDLILLSGIPPLVREGDKFAATFTARNTGKVALPVEVSVQLTPVGINFPAQQFNLAAGTARDVTWQITAPIGTARLTWDVSLRERSAQAVNPAGNPAGNKQAHDRMKVTQRVIPAFPVRTYQATLAQLTKPFTVQVAFPASAFPASASPASALPASELPASELPGRGGIEVSLHAKLGDGLDGVQAYMSGYPYNCLEQSLSRAVALHDRATWDAEMTTLAAYMDRDGLLKYFATDALPGEDTLTAYVLTIANETGWAIPEAQRKRLIDGLGNFVQGKIVRGSALPTADLAVRKLAAIDALARFSAAQPAMLDSITLEPNLWPTSAVLDWLSILRRMPRVAKAAAKRDTALGILRTRLNFQGTTMGFSTSRTDALWWLMVSEDSNAARTLIEVLDQAAWREDVPRLVRGLLGRQQRGHWNTTVANAWGTVAMQKFAKAFAASAVTGSTSVSYGQQHETVSYAESTHAAKPTNSQVLTLPWQPGTLPLSMVHTGTGAPWVMIRTTAAMPLTSALSSGYAITRTLSALEQRVPGKWSRGDVVRVRLSIDAQSDMTWVVVEDPVPGGATLLGTGLGGQSQLLAQGERREGWAWRAFEERTFDVFRAYYRFVPKGKFTVEYTLRLNNAGMFQLPATRVEAMYAPEMFGELPNATVVVAAP